MSFCWRSLLSKQIHHLKVTQRANSLLIMKGKFSIFSFFSAGFGKKVDLLEQFEEGLSWAGSTFYVKLSNALWELALILVLAHSCPAAMLVITHRDINMHTH